jgi:hypothetical protein
MYGIWEAFYDKYINLWAGILWFFTDTCNIMLIIFVWMVGEQQKCLPIPPPCNCSIKALKWNRQMHIEID